MTSLDFGSIQITARRCSLSNGLRFPPAELFLHWNSLVWNGLSYTGHRSCCVRGAHLLSSITTRSDLPTDIRDFNRLRPFFCCCFFWKMPYLLCSSRFMFVSRRETWIPLMPLRFAPDVAIFPGERCAYKSSVSALICRVCCATWRFPLHTPQWLQSLVIRGYPVP